MLHDDLHECAAAAGPAIGNILHHVLPGTRVVERDAYWVDEHRLCPGEGPISIGSILGALRARGYDRVASVEILRPQHWAQDAREVARTAHHRAVEILAQGGDVVDEPAQPSEA